MNFEDYIYSPHLRTRLAEMGGVNYLREETKAKILPFASLSRYGKAVPAETAYKKWVQSYKEISIVGLSENKFLRVEDFDFLSSSENNFSNWIGFLEEMHKDHEVLVPSALLYKDTNKRDFVKQIEKLESRFGHYAIKIDPHSKRDVLAAVTAASVVGDVENLIIFLDVGQITPVRQQSCLSATIDAINSIRQVDESINISTTGSSFPRAFTEYIGKNGVSGSIPMLEWVNFHAFGGSDVAMYGDYASIHGEFYQGSMAKFVARVDYPTPGEWVFERRPVRGKEDRQSLYAEAAQGIINNEGWDDELNAWGKEIIERVADGDSDGFKSPAKWISVRANIHIERIVSFLENNVVGEEGSADDWDEESLEW